MTEDVLLIEAEQILVGRLAPNPGLEKRFVVSGVRDRFSALLGK